MIHGGGGVSVVVVVDDDVIELAGKWHHMFLFPNIWDILKTMLKTIQQ